MNVAVLGAPYFLWLMRKSGKKVNEKRGFLCEKPLFSFILISPKETIFFSRI
ncbi:Iron compound ABC transporter, permease [Bacillus thuringiensis serovar pulsiensis BGSC 4CC1]|nr:Iron compound ABC transporter, permease [Bacillus thuringiensis serovar pulsiensis BGSC 4CC1]